MTPYLRITGLAALLAAVPSPAAAGVGDPQVGTDHPWYRGELACSTFQRLQRTQADLYRRVTGIDALSDQDRALASWLWRNTHYWHGEEGAEDLWGQGFTAGGDLRTRDYWTGLFAHGFGLCGTTHSQWIAEMEALLGHSRGRGVGVEGHNSFEVFLAGGPYGAGKWALLDHDVSTVIFNPEGTALLSIPEVRADLSRLIDRSYRPEKQHGWLVCGLSPGDGGVYRKYEVAEYLAGYAGAPPMVHLRRGEMLRRYFAPGMEDGKTFVFWGRDYNPAGIPGPERSQTWVNQPDRMYGSREGTGYHPGQARYANAVYTYRPDFASGDYREGVIDESPNHITFEFYTPYIIGATPPTPAPWGIYEKGGRNGLILRGKARCPVSLSTDQGKTWTECGQLADGLDLTDIVKGRRQYFIRFGASAVALRDTGLTIRTVCQMNSSIVPRLKDGGSEVRFESTRQALVSAGPNLPQAAAHVVDGAFGTPRVTLRISTPRGESPTAIYAAAHTMSGNPPAPDVKYRIEYSPDGGKSWGAFVSDWIIPRRPEEPRDFWSQSLCWGSAWMPSSLEPHPSVLVRFSNDGGKPYARCEAHLAYSIGSRDPTKVIFEWKDDSGSHRATHVYPGAGSSPWKVPTGRDVKTRWVEMTPLPGG